MCVCVQGLCVCVCVYGGGVLTQQLRKPPTKDCHCPAQRGLQSDERGDSTAN